MNYSHLKVKTLTRTIFSINGIALTSGLSFLISNKSTKIVDQKNTTCLIYLDNGSNCLQDFNQHIVNKKLLYDNSI